MDIDAEKTAYHSIADIPPTRLRVRYLTHSPPTNAPHARTHSRDPSRSLHVSCTSKEKQWLLLCPPLLRAAGGGQTQQQQGRVGTAAAAVGSFRACLWRSYLNQGNSRGACH